MFFICRPSAVAPLFMSFISRMLSIGLRIGGMAGGGGGGGGGFEHLFFLMGSLNGPGSWPPTPGGPLPSGKVVKSGTLSVGQTHGGGSSGKIGLCGPDPDSEGPMHWPPGAGRGCNPIARVSTFAVRNRTSRLSNMLLPSPGGEGKTTRRCSIQGCWQRVGRRSGLARDGLNQKGCVYLSQWSPNGQSSTRARANPRTRCDVPPPSPHSLLAPGEVAGPSLLAPGLACPRPHNPRPQS